MSAERVRKEHVAQLQQIRKLHDETPPDNQTPTSTEAIQLLKEIANNPENCMTDDITQKLGDLLATVSNEVPGVLFEEEPHTWDKAKRSPDATRWEAGYREELRSLKEMGVYELVPRESVPASTKIRKGRPLFVLKRDEYGELTRWKVRLVFKGFEQIYSRDYTKTTSLTAQMESWRILLHIAATLGWDAQQINIKMAFLYGLLPEGEVQYMEQPEGFLKPGKESWVWKLLRGLYGMKQAGRIWNRTMNEAMISWGFTHLGMESCVYCRLWMSGIIITAVHMDNFLAIASSKEENSSFKEDMPKIWTISNLGDTSFCIGIAIKWDRIQNTVYLSQMALIDRVVAQFGQKDSHPVTTPIDPGLKLRRPDKTSTSSANKLELERLPYRSLVGSLIYISVGT